MTLDKKSWGFRRDADLADFYDMDGLIQVLAETIRLVITIRRRLVMRTYPPCWVFTAQ